VSRVKVWVLPFAACCLLLAACVLPGSVETTIKVGLSAPFEGLYRDLGYEALNAVRLAVRQRNRAGGVGGRYLVEQVALNDFNEAEEAVQQAHEMAADPGVLAVLGGWSLQTAHAAAPEYERLGLAFVTPEMDWTSLAGAAARAAAGDGSRRLAAVLYSPDPADTGLAQSFAEVFAAQGGSIAALETPAGDDWAQQLMQGGEHPPDAVFMAGDAPTAAGWIVALRDAGFGGSIVGGPELGSTIVVDIAGQASEGVVYISPFPPLAGDPEFVAAYRGQSGGVPPGPAAGWAYAAANRLLDALDLVSRGREHPSRAAVKETLAAESGDQAHTYTYVIQSGNLFTTYQSPSTRY
jgi:branched-chain amino acid transport system substrate-binding protein